MKIKKTYKILHFPFIMGKCDIFEFDLLIIPTFNTNVF